MSVFYLCRLIKSDILKHVHLNYSSLNLLNIIKVLLSFRFHPVLIIRLSYFFSKIRLSPLSYILCYLNLIIYGIEYTPKCKIGYGLFIAHSTGIIIGASSIGDNCTIYQNVTIGAKFLDTKFNINYRPCVGSDVTIGAGTVILGDIIINDGEKIPPLSFIRK